MSMLELGKAKSRGRWELPVEVPIQHTSPIYPLGSVLLAATIFVFDTFVPEGGAIAVLYVLVVILSAQFLDRLGVLVVAAACIILTLTSFMVGHLPAIETDAVIRCGVSVSAIVLTTSVVLKNLAVTSGLKRQAALLALTHDAIYVTDSEGRITYWNRGAEALYGWPAVEAIGCIAVDLLKTDSTPDNRGRSASRPGQADSWEAELVRVKKDGTPVIVANRWSLQRNVRGEPVAIMETSNDITLQEQANEQLRAREEELRRVVDTIPALLWSTGPDLGSVIYVNERWSDMGWSMEKLRATKWGELVHPDDQASDGEKVRRFRAAGKPYEIMTRLKSASGEYRRTFLRSAPLHDENGKIIRWYGVASDIEDSRRIEDALHRAQAELSHMARITTLGELTASIAHEVNQPLAAVVTNGEAGLRWMSRTPPNLEAVHNSLQKMIANARRASDVIARLRALASRSEPEYTPVDLNALLDESLLLVQREIRSHQVKLQLVLDRALPRIIGDRIQLQQVVINLVMNAVQAMEAVEERTRILRIETSREGCPEHVVIDVIDSGSGIDDATMSKLFTAFYSTKKTGMGMGLSISRSIVEAHLGRIIATRNDGPGATFTIRLPVTVQENA